MPTGTLYTGGVQIESAAWPSAYIKTLGAAVTRSRDTIIWTHLLTPRAMSVYVQFTEAGTILAGNSARIIHIGALAATTDPRFLIYAEGGVYKAMHDNGTTESISAAAAAPALGDTVELLATISSTGACTLTQSINAGTAVTASAGSAATLGTAWAGIYCTVNGVSGGVNGRTMLHRLRIGPGTETMATARRG